MSTIDTLCALVELDLIPATDTSPSVLVIKRIVRTFEAESRAAEDLELLQEMCPASRFRIDPIVHIER